MKDFKIDVIDPIADLLNKQLLEEAIEKTKALSNDDRFELLCYINDNLYDFQDNDDDDFVLNGHIIFFMRSFKSDTQRLYKLAKKDALVNNKFVNSIDEEIKRIQKERAEKNII